MKITTDLTKDDYQKLIMEAHCDILNHISHKPIKMNIKNNEIIGEMQCLGVNLTDGGITIEGKYVPPYMRFAFKVIFDSDNIDLVKMILESKDVIVDDKKYYVGDYTLQNKIFNLRFISYDLFKSEVE